MDPNNNQSQGDNSNLQKLESDLQNLTAQAQEQPPISPNPTVSQTETASPEPASPAVPAPQPITPGTPPEQQPKKGSPLLIISLVLVIVAILAIVAYILASGLLNPNNNVSQPPLQTLTPVVTRSPTPVATSSATPTIVPTTTPTTLSSMTPTPSATPATTY